MEEGKEIKKKKKGKEIKREDIFLGEKMKIMKLADSQGFGCGCGNLSEKYRNRPEIKYFGTTRKNYQKSRI